MRLTHATHDVGQLEGCRQTWGLLQEFHITSLCAWHISASRSRSQHRSREASTATVNGDVDELACGIPGSAASLRFAGGSAGIGACSAACRVARPTIFSGSQSHRCNPESCAKRTRGLKRRGHLCTLSIAVLRFGAQPTALLALAAIMASIRMR
jgi:hypothetical protein